MVARRRSGTLSTRVVAAGAARTSVVVRVAAGGLDACSSELLLKVGDGNMKFSKVLQGDEDLGVGTLQSTVSVLLVTVRAATEARSLAVAVARLAMVSSVSFW